jgi:uncharacterized coiled-coil protein SlyX
MDVRVAELERQLARKEKEIFDLALESIEQKKIIEKKRERIVALQIDNAKKTMAYSNLVGNISIDMGCIVKKVAEMDEIVADERLRDPAQGLLRCRKLRRLAKGVQHIAQSVRGDSTAMVELERSYFVGNCAPVLLPVPLLLKGKVLFHV